ncbi:MAG TPA: Gldg family protein [Thermoguttaceae bacterium]|nr:Gldg family protein [Thermoguttaceae bacterium]
MNTKVLRAVFKRDFVSYFANPTGYVFICVFVLLSTIAAFWPNEFFVTNLANLDQLNKMFPFIMLVFIPAVTMAIWAGERRQGTDELLLTVPAGDLDIVVGKYLAGVAIYSVALLFSLVCNYSVLAFLGDPDTGLLVGTYVGYWLVGLAMLAAGMVASFLTSNLTVAYVLGAVFNVPLVFAVKADVISSREMAMAIKQWSIGEQFRDLGRGIISLSGLVYFGAIVAVALYASMVLIGRRHWIRGRVGYLLMGAHYLVRGLSLAVIAIAVIVLFNHHDLRPDVTSERLSSLSPDTVKLLKNLQVERPVQIEAFVSPTVPEAYVQTRADLLSMLRELHRRGGEKVEVRVNDTEQFSEQAARAEQRYDITPREVTTEDRGSFSQEPLFMGVAFTCGLEKVILPFIDRGIPVEYELVRSIATVTQQKRKKVGIVDTDAQLYGQFNMQTMSSTSNWPVVDELEKQYDVERIDASSPISDEYDVLLAVQPSSLGPEQMDNFAAAVRSGIPTAIFEDPFPFFAGQVPGTNAPRRPPGGMNPMMGGQPPVEKGNRAALWDLLKVDFGETQVVWQDYNPYRRYSDWPKEFVFVDKGSGAEEPFGESEPATSGLQHMLFPFPGSIRNLNVSNLKFTPLVRTGDDTGTVNSDEIIEMSFLGRGGMNPNRRQVPTAVPYVLAAHIQGKVEPDEPSKRAGAAEEDADDGDGDEGDGDEGDDAAGSSDDSDKAEEAAPDEEAAKPKHSGINVVLVADIDMLNWQFFRLREAGEVPDAGVRFDFDNVTFVLNVLDTLAGDDRFLEIRKRRPKHRTLTRIEKSTENARKQRWQQIEDLRDKYEKVEEEEEQKLKDRVAKMEERMKKEGGLSIIEIMNRVGMAQRDGERRKQIKLEQLKQETDREINRIETDLSLEIRRLERWYKMWAVLLPPIPPLLLAIGVFVTRRIREREGVVRSRLRS